MLHSLTRAKLALPPPGPFLVPTIILTSFCGSLLPPSKFRGSSIAATISYLLVLIIRNPTGNKINDMFLPIQGLVLLAQWVDLYVLHTPEREFWRLKDGENEKARKGGKAKDDSVRGNERMKEIGRMGWKEKLKWVSDLKFTLRGVGWNWKVKNVPDETSKSKWFCPSISPPPSSINANRKVIGNSYALKHSRVSFSISSLIS
jgi:hypothetical protein